MLYNLPKMNLPGRNKKEDRRRDGQGVMVNNVMTATLGNMDYLVEVVPVGVIRSLRPITRMVFVQGEQGTRLFSVIQLMNGKDRLGDHGCSSCREEHNRRFARSL
jgi:hypothetical protein